MFEKSLTGNERSLLPQDLIGYIQALPQLFEGIDRVVFRLHHVLAEFIVQDPLNVEVVDGHARFEDLA